MKTQWLRPTPSHSWTAFMCPYSQFRCRNESSWCPELFSETLPRVNLPWYVRICSCHRGWFRIWMKPASWQQSLCPLASLFKIKLTACTNSGTMLNFFWLLFPSIVFPFSKNTLLYGKKEAKLIVSHNLFCVNRNTIAVALHKLSIIALLKMESEQNES